MAAVLFPRFSSDGVLPLADNDASQFSDALLHTVNVRSTASSFPPSLNKLFIILIMNFAPRERNDAALASRNIGDLPR